MILITIYNDVFMIKDVELLGNTVKFHCLGDGQTYKITIATVLKIITF